MMTDQATMTHVNTRGEIVGMATELQIPDDPYIPHQLHLSLLAEGRRIATRSLSVRHLVRKTTISTEFQLEVGLTHSSRKQQIGNLECDVCNKGFSLVQE